MNTPEAGKIFSTAKQRARLVTNSLNQLLWPIVCANCGNSVGQLDEGLCRNCWDELLLCSGSDYCPRCGVDASKYALLGGRCPNCQNKQIYFDSIARSGVYTGALRNMILAFKASGRIELDYLLSSLANSSLQGSSFCNDVEFLVPVPLHWARRLVRGYNQSFIIAKRLKHLSSQISTDLVRIRYTKTQVSLTPAKRASNVAGAFAVCYGHKFTGRAICLVDDIKTTGATLNECAKTLKQAGAAKIFALVLAVAGQDLNKP